MVDQYIGFGAPAAEARVRFLAWEFAFCLFCFGFSALVSGNYTKKFIAMFKLSKYLMRNVASGFGPRTHVQGVNKKTKIQNRSKLWKLNKVNAPTHYISISCILQSLIITGKNTELFLNTNKSFIWLKIECNYQCKSRWLSSNQNSHYNSAHPSNQNSFYTIAHPTWSSG